MPACLILATCGCSSNERLTTVSNEPTFTVLTYNLFADRPDYESAERIIRASNADVVVLQEVTPQCVPTFEALKHDYPYQHWADDAPERDTAILSELPLKEARHLPARYGWHGAWFARVVTPLGEVQVLGVHLMPPLTPERQFTFAAMFEAAAVHQREIDAFCENVNFNMPLVILGDFNEDEYGDAATSLRRRGLKRAAALRNLLTPTWRYVEFPLIARRLDHVYHTKDLTAVETVVIEDGESDHWPVLARFQGSVDRNAPSLPERTAGSTTTPENPSRVTISATHVAGQSVENH